MRDSEATWPDPAGVDLPLAGVLVLDLSQFLAGPSCALRLADFGADVIKVERPQGGDLCRGLHIADLAFEGDSALFHTINRGKQSFTADLKNPGDLRRVAALVERADVLIHNFRPGVMERLGLDYEAARTLNPRLIYATVTGYGEQGPWRNKPGQDLLVQALSGFTWLSGDADQGPVPAGVSVADLAAGSHLAQGVLAALVRRGVTGRGARIEVSLMESALDLQFEQFTTFLNSDRAQPRRSAVNNANVYVAAPYGLYRSADGHLAVAMTPVGRLAELIDCPALAPYTDPARAFADRDAIKAILAVHLATRPTAYWLGLLEPVGIWCAEVLDWPALAAHPGFAALDAIQEVEGEQGARLVTTRCPVRIDGAVLKAQRAGPRLGADTDAIAARFGLPPAEDRS
ncbi:CaiB/BaiF CoA transferase family protein [Lichenihabitans psoromatis]|uniref:CaiB/BaiF CoA transferase family protein n=1 Tax=Lichenihabitans psoromatis TaxID=2528642 RepID=UPI00103835AF|nr:CaiB/BaiF CoA-transferase family protein [Lichenihabitans psoromatis]